MKIIDVSTITQDNALDYFSIRKVDYSSSEYRIHYCLSGDGIFRIGNVLTPINRNDFIFTYPNEKYSIWSSSLESISIVTISFFLIKTDFRLYNLIHYSLKQERIFHPVEDMSLLVKTIYDNFTSKSEMKETALTHLLLSIIYLLPSDDKATVLDDEQKKYVDKSISFMRDNITHVLTLNEICSSVNVTQSYLIKLFNIYTGTTPIKFFNHLRIEHSCKLLTEELLSISQVVDKMNFSSESHFCRSFKKITGLSPHLYKKEQLQKIKTIDFHNKENINDMFYFMQKIIDSAVDLIFFKDKQGVLLGCNDAFCKIMGLTKDQVIGKRDIDIFPKEEADFYNKMDKIIFKSGKAQRNKEWMTYPNGKKCLFEVYKGPITDADNNIIGIVGISRDITNWEKE